MNRYGQTALKAVKNYKDSYSVAEIYTRAAKEIFYDSISSQNKSCPKSAFLGLCEKGLVKGIAEGKYTRSIDTKAYAVKAIDILRSNTKINYTPKELWVKVKKELFIKKKAHNSQMDVVLALWENGLIK